MRALPAVAYPQEPAAADRAGPAVAPTSDTVPHGRRDLPSLTGLRFVAALMVFAFHTHGFGLLATPWWHLPEFGFVGVSFFFVLSGVVLTWSARPGQSARGFWWRRFARIYPAHAVMTGVAIVLYLAVMPPHKPLWAGLLALLLLQAWPPRQLVNSAANGVSWSLSCEAFFYALFPAVAAALGRRDARRRRTVVTLLVLSCAAVAVACSVAWGGRWDVEAYENPLVRLGEFVLGVAIGLRLREGWTPQLRVPAAWAAVAAGCAVSLLAGLLRGWPVPRGIADTVLVGPFALLLVAYAGRDLAGRRTAMASRWAVYLGQLSFAFYLVHQVVMDLVIKRLLPFSHPTVAGGLLRTGISLVLSVLAAMALHHGVELPGQRRLAGRRRDRNPTVIAVATEAREPALAGAPR